MNVIRRRWYGINTKCCMLSSRRTCTLARDAILRGAQITSNVHCPLITYQSFGLDKKLSNPVGLLNFLEAPPGFEPGDRGFADLCLTAWPWRRLFMLIYYNKVFCVCQGVFAEIFCFLQIFRKMSALLLSYADTSACVTRFLYCD